MQHLGRLTRTRALGPRSRYRRGMQAQVRLRTQDGNEHDVPAGGIIGRLAGAALVLPDPRVSEAHAMVSLRGGSLHLLTLRGRFATEGRTPSSMVLVTGQRIEFARGLWVEVVDVVLPERVRAVRLEGGAALPLAGVTSLVRTAGGCLVQRYEADAIAVIWSQDGNWWWRPAQGEAAPLPADGFDVAGLRVECLDVQVQRLNTGATRQQGAVAAPLRVVCHFDSVQIHREGQQPLTVTGNGARIISELVALGAPVEWQTLAREIWGKGPSNRIRHNLDQTLLRLRKKLIAGRIRPDLVRNDGSGKMELVLVDGDKVEDLS